MAKPSRTCCSPPLPMGARSTVPPAANLFPLAKKVSANWLWNCWEIGRSETLELGQLPPSLQSHVKRLFQTGQRFFAPLPIDHHAHANLAGVNHADVDPALRQGAEHAPGHAGVGPHA